MPSTLRNSRMTDPLIRHGGLVYGDVAVRPSDARDSTLLALLVLAAGCIPAGLLLLARSGSPRGLTGARKRRWGAVHVAKVVEDAV